MNRPVELAEWEGQPIEAWRRAWGVPRLQVFASVDSTNDLARALAEAGAPAGTTVLAEHQRRGRGQHGRPWHAPPATSVLLSMVLRPRTGETDATPGVLPIRAGLATAGALEELAGLAIGLKWPNDIMLGERKLGGILCEGALSGRLLDVVVGIGLNVLQTPGDFPGGLEPAPVSLAMVGDRPVRRAAVAGALVHALVGLGEDAARPLSAAELRDFDSRDILRGRAIRIDDRPAGTAMGLAPDGALLVRSQSGTARFRSGTARPDPRFHGATP